MGEFSLRRQLEDAKEQRRLAAGLAPEPKPAVRPVKVPRAAQAERTELEALIVDLRDPSSVMQYRSPSASETPSEPAADPARVHDADRHASGGGASGISLPVWQGSQGDDPSGATLTATRFAQASTRVADSDGEAVSTRTPTKDLCPTCGGKVRLDRFDLVQAVAHMSCVDCSFAYQAKSPKL